MPNVDCLKMHAARACYQAAIWHRSLESSPPVPSPCDSDGWGIDEDGKLTNEWMSGALAPVCVLEFLSCNCKKVCQLPSCTCLENGMKCTEACVLQDCGNMNDPEINPFEQTADDGSDDSGADDD